MFEGRFCIVRTNSSGVQAGVVREHTGRQVVLTEARILWDWNADDKKPRTNTIYEISLRGVSEQSNVSEPVAESVLLDAITIVPCTPESEANLRRSRWRK